MRTDTLFGKNVNVVGNVSADLVLESLGKIYIKSRNKALTLDEIISSLTSGSGESIANKTIIIDGLEELDELNIKDGSFIYDKSSDILYIKVDGELVELISVSTLDTRYVKKTGDTMTGALTINTLSGTPPLRVTSASLVKNLNALYLEGLPSNVFALKNKNEVIGGSWQFNNDTYFNHPVYYRANTLHYKDSLHAGSVGTPDFASGFGGYGWRIDGQTNTLTIDYIVVRKAMYVYELVVNKVRATNGSLWVTNSSKVQYACRLKVINADALTIWQSISPSSSSGINTAIKSAILGLLNHEGLIVTHNGVSIDNWSSDLMSSNTGEGLAKSDYNYKNLKVFLCNDLSKVTSFILDVNNSGRTFSFREEDLLGDETNSIFSYDNLFDPYFDTNVVMPIAVIKEGINWYNDSNGADREDVYDVKYVKTYHKYFSQEALGNTPIVYDTNLYLVQFDTENLPVFLPGDILRCQKFTGDGIKYYDAVVCNKLKDSIFVILLAESILDKSTTIIYDDNLNPTITREEDHINLDFYNRHGSRSRDMLGTVQEGDDVVLIGHLWDVTRQNAVYITSSDDGSPFIDTMSLVNRPDYSVIYYTPTFLTIKLYKGQALPFTGNYYILTNTTEGIQTGLYALAYKTDEEGLTTSYSMELNKVPTRIIIWYKSGDNLYRTNFDDLFDSNLFTDDEREAILSNPVRLQEEPTGGNATTVLSLMLIKLLMLSKFEEDLTDFTILVLRGYPNEYTLLVTSYKAFDLLLENGEIISQEELEESIILEQDIKKDTITPTRTTKARFGRLDGIIDSRFSIDKQPHGFGLYGENVFLTGEFILSNGKNVADFEKDFLLLSSGIEQNSNVFLNLRQDLINLANNTPNYGNLESAGVFLTNNKLILYGDTVMIITQQDELSGNSEPTALFADGKINAKFIATQVIRSNVPLYKNSTTHVAKEVPASSVSLYNGDSYYTYDGDSLVYEYREPIDYSHYTTKYIRKYSRSGEECWLYTDIYGYPKKEITYSYLLTNCSPTIYVEYYNDPTLINVTADSPKFILYYHDFNATTGLYDSQDMYIKTVLTNYLFVQYKYYTDEEHYTQYIWDILEASTASNTELDSENNPVTSGTGYIQYLAFKKDLLDVVLWSLNIDGTGNLGGDGIYWDSNGILNVSGIINALGGKIGNIGIKDNCLYKNVNSSLETLTSFYLGGADGSERLELTNWVQSGNCESGTISTRTLLNSSLLEITSGKSMEDASNGVQLTPEGLVWKHEGIPITSSSILFSITVIPVKDGNGLWLPLIRTNYASFNMHSSVIGDYKKSPFSNVNIYMKHSKDADWGSGGGGLYLIYFPELDNAIYGRGTELYSWGDWMYNRVLEGRVIFLVTGLGEKKLYNEGSFDADFYREYDRYDYFDFYNESAKSLKANILSFSFGAGYMTQFHYHSPGELSLDKVKHDYNICYFSRPKYYIGSYISSDPNELGNRILYATSNNANSDDDLWWIYDLLITSNDEKLTFRRLGLFGPDQSFDCNSDYPVNGTPTHTDVFKSYTYAEERYYPNNEKNFIRGIKNYIRINTADDDTLNSGGFTLTAFYLSGLNINNSSVTATIKS